MRMLNGALYSSRLSFKIIYLNECSTVVFRCEFIHDHEVPLNLPRKMISNSAKRKVADLDLLDY